MKHYNNKIVFLLHLQQRSVFRALQPS